MKRIAILASGRGTNADAVMEAAERGELPAARVVAVITDRPGARVADRARHRGVEAISLDRRALGKERFDAALRETLLALDADIVVLAGYLEILDPETVAAFRGRIINVHPSLLPDFGGRGMYGERVHRAVLAAGRNVTGATVHLVDEGVDTGPVLLQERVPVLDGDTPSSLAERVLEVEHRLLVGAVGMLCREAS